MNWIPLAGIAVGFGLLVILPIVAILTEHQRKMARILHGLATPEELAEKSQLVIGVHGSLAPRQGKSEDNVLDELRALRGEVADLRLQVASIDSIRELESVRDRLSQN
jgi:hypothetical protein